MRDLLSTEKTTQHYEEMIVSLNEQVDALTKANDLLEQRVEELTMRMGEVSLQNKAPEKVVLEQYRNKVSECECEWELEWE